jgi:cell fate (sporulation/competence/biofilm development) regulator YlbF (YheA/YmcA/DUF963 family)
VNPTRCYVTQFIYFNKTLYMFQAVPAEQQTAARFDRYQKLYVQFELLMMGGGTA